MTALGDRMVHAAPFVLLGADLVWVVSHTAGPLHDPDVWWHLRLGEDLLHQGSLSTPAHWSSYATVSWVPSEPLPEVAAALVHRTVGLPGLAWLYTATVLCLILTVYAVCRLRSDPLPAALATTLFAAVGEGELTPRPQLVSYFLLIVVVETWRRSEQDLRPRWWLVPLCFVWSLCHGFWFIGVTYGLVAVVAVALGRRATPRRLLRLAAVAVGSGLVVLLNPIGLGVFEAPFQVSSTSQYISEWRHPHLLSGQPGVATAMAVMVAAVWIARRSTTTWFCVLVLVSAVCWDWYALRTMVLGALLSAPLLAEALQALLPTPAPEDAGERRSRRDLTWCAAMLGAVLAVAALVVPHTAGQPGRVPVALDPTLARLPPGTRVFNAYSLGGWLAWRHPGLNRYLDGLVTPYSPEHVGDYYRALTLGPGWYDVVRRSQAPVALLATNASLTAALEARGWTSGGSDAGYVLLRRPGH